VIFSTGTYAYLAELIFVFLVTDLLRYKPVIVFDGISAIITWIILIWGSSTLQMQVMISFTWNVSIDADCGCIVFCVLQRNIEYVP
jgi:thiamine transporter 2/3